MDDMSEDDEMDEIMDDIQEVLKLARRQRAIAPVRVARILAGEGTSQFSVVSDGGTGDPTAVPLSVALDYVGTVLEESRHEVSRLKAEIEEYNQLCNSMEMEIDSLLRTSSVLPQLDEEQEVGHNGRMDIEELFVKVKMDREQQSVIPEQAREAFWREMNQTDDNFDTIARFFGKGLIH